MKHRPRSSLSIVEAVEQAIEHGAHPRRNAKGSSGSYLARDESGEIVGCADAAWPRLTSQRLQAQGRRALWPAESQG